MQRLSARPTAGEAIIGALFLSAISWKWVAAAVQEITGHMSDAPSAESGREKEGAPKERKRRPEKHRILPQRTGERERETDGRTEEGSCHLASRGALTL